MSIRVWASAVALVGSVDALAQNAGTGVGCPHATLAAAIAAAPNGGSVYLRQGITRNEGGFTITKDLTISTGTNTCGSSSTATMATISGNSGALGPITVAAGADVTFSRVMISNHTGVEGGNLHVDGNVVLADSVLSFGEADRGGGVFVDTGGRVTTTGHASMAANEADDGGGAYVDTGGELVLEDRSLIWSNVANTGFGGGGVYVNGGTLEMSDTAGIEINDASFGGGILLLGGTWDATCTGNGCEVDGNVAAADGGGVWAVAGSVVDLYNVHIGSNGAGANAGGMFVDGDLVGYELDIEGNQAGLAAGGLSVTGTGWVGGSRITDNHALSGIGGGLYLYDGVVEVENTEIDANTAEDGAGIYVDGDELTLRGSYIHGNEAEEDGGGLYVTGGATAEARGCWFHENAAGSEGGGILVDDGPVAANLVVDGVKGDEGCTVGWVTVPGFNQYCSEIRDNTAANGGGLFARGGVVDIDRTAFIANSGASQGAALQLSGGLATAYLTNVLVAGHPGASPNASVHVGANTTLDARSVTVTDNANLPVVYSSGALGQFIRGIVWDNGGAFITSVLTPRVADCTAFGPITGMTSGPARTFGVDPLLVASARGDYRLDPAASPSRDACGSGPGGDLDTDPRPIVIVNAGTPFDRGAFEVQ